MGDKRLRRVPSSAAEVDRATSSLIQVASQSAQQGQGWGLSPDAVETHLSENVAKPTSASARAHRTPLAGSPLPCLPLPHSPRGVTDPPLQRAGGRGSVGVGMGRASDLVFITSEDLPPAMFPSRLRTSPKSELKGPRDVNTQLLFNCFAVEIL